MAAALACRRCKRHGETPAHSSFPPLRARIRVFGRLLFAEQEKGMSTMRRGGVYRILRVAGKHRGTWAALALRLRCYKRLFVRIAISGHFVLRGKEERRVRVRVSGRQKSAPKFDVKVPLSTVVCCVRTALGVPAQRGTGIVGHQNERGLWE